MDEIQDGGAPAEKDQFDAVSAWFAFEHKLRAHLEQMEQREWLRIELPGALKGNLPTYVRLYCRSAGVLSLRRAASAATVVNEDAAMRFAREVVAWFRDTCGVALPQLLAYRAGGPTGRTVADLGIQKIQSVPRDKPRAASAKPVLAMMPKDRDALVELVARALAKKFECEVPRDDDGDWVLEHLDQPVYVRVRPDQPGVEICARVAHDVWSRRQTAIELTLLNRDHCWVTWHLLDRAVFQRIQIPALPFVAQHLDGMLDAFFAAMTETRNDLALRCAGKVA